MRFTVAFTTLLIVPTLTWGHGGGLDSSGCHNNRKTGDYHCHRSQSTYSSPSSNASSSNSGPYNLPSYQNKDGSYRSQDTKSTYARSKFGSGWADTDKDCQDSRQEALIAQSTAPVRFNSRYECKVASGRWISPFTGKVIQDPSVIDIDHVVPLKWAWEHGASKWKKSKRERFANDPANLLAVEASLNRQKGAKGPINWMPPAEKCGYLARFKRIMKKYDLKLSHLEKVRFKEVEGKSCQ